MLIVRTCLLTYDMLDSMTDLVLDVNETDGVKYTVPDDADMYVLLYEDGTEDITEEILYDEEDFDPDEISETRDPDSLVSFMAAYEMGETLDNMPVAELSAFTAPKKRRKGYFRKALMAVSGEYEGYRLRFAVYEGTGVLGALKGIGAGYDHDELMMSRAIEEPEEQDTTSRALFETEISTEAVGDPDTDGYYEGSVTSRYGECSFRIYGDYAYIYGILTYESYMRKGCASEMLRQLLGYLGEQGVPMVMLEVSSGNLPAVSLYRKLGFEETEKLSYYYL